MATKSGDDPADMSSRRRENCYSCKKKIKGERFKCCYCDKVMHMTDECTGFSSEEVNVLIKLSRNLLHVCNDCALDESNRDNSFLKSPVINEIDVKLTQLDKKVTNYNDQLVQAFQGIKKLETELQKSKTDTTYAAALGQVVPGKVIDNAISKLPIPTLGLRIRGIPESEGNPDDRLKSDLRNVKSIIEQGGRK